MSGEAKVCARFFVSGRVQGVFFRGAAQMEARRLKLCGRARNLEDGRVEVIACGAAGAVDALEHWLWKGPPAARVSDVQRDALPFSDEYADFDVG